MTVKIGEKIKILRREKEVTQEKLAEYLGVTAQAVSRWESENCYPDIELLPSIASFFDITIDNLLNYDPSEQKQNIFINRITELTQKGCMTEAIAEARRALALYPQNFAITLLLASHLFGAGHPKKDNIQVDEAIALCQRVLRDCEGGRDVNDIIRLSAKNILIAALSDRERKQEAKQIAETMPSVVMVREFVYQAALTGNDRKQYSLSVLPVIITMLTSSFLNNYANSDNEKATPLHKYNSEECLRDIAIWDAIYYDIDKEDSGTAKRSCWAYMFLHQRLAKNFLDKGDKNEALKYLKAAIDCLPFVDSDKNNFTYNLVARNALLNIDPYLKQDNYEGKSSAFVLLNGYIKNGYYSELEHEPLYKEYLELLEKNVK